MKNKIAAIPITKTILSPENIALTISLLIIMPLVCYFWGKRAAKNPQDERVSLGFRDEPKIIDYGSVELNSRVWCISIGAAGLFVAGSWVFSRGIKGFSINEMNTLFLFLAIIVHGRLGSFLRAFRGGVAASAGILLLFPLYSGIMVIVRDSGLAVALTEAMQQTANREGLPFLTFVSAGLLNVFVPSGGGQWAIQGPIVVATSNRLVIPPNILVMAVAYGDQITNMLQPFWALPLLGITQLKTKELLRYSIPFMFIGGALMTLTLFIWIWRNPITAM